MKRRLLHVLQRVVVCLLLLSILVLCVCAANGVEPRSVGKAAMLEALARVEPTWVLPHARLDASQTADADAAAAPRGVLESLNIQVPLPWVVKPDTGTCRSVGVTRATSAESARAAVQDLARVLGTLPSPPAVLVQAWHDGPCEARIFATRPTLSTRAPFLLHPAVLEHGSNPAQTQARALPPALQRRMSDALNAAWPHTPALALDVLADSWDALAAGRFVVVEVNGSLGVPRRHADAQLSWAPRVAYTVLDALEWFCTRFGLGAARLLTSPAHAAYERAAHELALARHHARTMDALQAQHSSQRFHALYDTL